MFAPAPMATLPLSWDYVTATLTALPVVLVGQNLSVALGAALIPINLPIFFREPNPNIFHPAVKKEGVCNV